MSIRPRHPVQPSDTSQDPHKLWRQQENQVESDSDRPRYKTTTTNRAQRDQRDANYRGYKSDSASTSQYRSGTSTSKTSHHPNRPSTSNNYLSRSQQPVSNSTTPSTQQNRHPSRGQPPRSQAEIYDPRLYSHKHSTPASIPTPQSSYERVPSSDEFAKTSRTNPYPRSGAPVHQTTTGPEVWMPPPRDTSSRKVSRDREKDKEKEKGRDREKDKVIEKLKDISDRYLEEKYADAHRDVSRDAYRDAYRDRDKPRERDRERRSDREKEVASHRDLRSTSRAPTARDAQDPTTREPGAPAPSHRRYRSEDLPSSSATTRRPHTDTRQPSTSAAAAQPASTPNPVSGGSAKVPPTPRAMPVYLPERQPTSTKERAASNPPNSAAKGVSTNNAEQPPRREQYHRNDPHLATTNPATKDYGSSRPERVQGDRPSEPPNTQVKNKLEAGFRSIRSMLSGSQVPPTPVLKPSEVDLSIPRDTSGPSSSSLSVLPAENRRRASAKPHFVSIRAGQGPSDPQPPDALYKQSAASTREGHFDMSGQPAVTPPSGGRVHDRVKSYEAYMRGEVAAPGLSHANTNSVEPTSRSGPTLKTSVHQYTNTEPMSRDRAQTSEPSTRVEATGPISSRIYTNGVEPASRSAPTPKQPAIQPISTETTGGDRVQTYEPSTRGEVPAPSRARTNNPEPMNRTASKTSVLQPAGAESLVRDRAQRYDTYLRAEGNAPASSNAHTGSVESAKRSASNPKPSAHHSTGSETASHERAHPLEVLTRSEAISFHPRAQASNVESTNRLAAAPKQHQSTKIESTSRDRVQTHEDTTRPDETAVPPSHAHTISVEHNIRSAKVEAMNDRLQTREGSTRPETSASIPSRLHATSVEPANRTTMAPPKLYQPGGVEPTSRDPTHAYEDSARPETTAPRFSRAHTGGAEPADRSARVEVTNRDRLQTHEISTRPEAIALAPSRVHTSSAEVVSRSTAAPRLYQPTRTESSSREHVQTNGDFTLPSGVHASGSEPINRSAKAEPTSRDRSQAHNIPTRPDATAPHPSYTHTSSVEVASRSTTAPTPYQPARIERVQTYEDSTLPSGVHVDGGESTNKSAKTEPMSRDRLQAHEISTRPEATAPPPSRTHTSSIEVASRSTAAPTPYQPARAERVQTYEDSTLPSGAHTHEGSTRVETSASSRPLATSVELANSSTAAAKPYQSARTETASRDRDDSTRPEGTAAPSGAYAGIDPNNRSTRAGPTSRDRLQTHEAFIKPEAIAITPSRAHASGAPTHMKSHQPTSTDTTSRIRTQASDALTQSEFSAPIPSRPAVNNETNNRSAPAPKPAISRSTDAVSAIRQAAIRTVRFDVPDSEPATSPGVASTDLPQIMPSVPHPSQPVSANVDEVRQPPSSISLVAAASSGSRQLSPPPSPAHLKLPSSLQPKDRSPSHAARAIELERLATQQVTPEVASSSPSAPKPSLTRSAPAQMEISDARAVTHTRAPPLTAISSQSQPLFVPMHQETVLQTMPSQSIQNTIVSDEPLERKPGDSRALPADRSLKQGSAEVNVVPQQQFQSYAPASQTTSSVNQRRTISNPTRPPVSVSEMQTSSTATASKPPTTLPTQVSHTITSLQTAPSQSRVNTNGVHPHANVAQVDPRSEKYIPPAQDKPAGLSHLAVFQDAPSMSVASQRIASVSTKEQEAPLNNAPVVSHNAAPSIAQAHTQDNIVPSSSSSEQSRRNHRDTQATRQKIQVYAPAPQRSDEESTRNPLARDAPVANMSQSSFQNNDPKASTAATLPVRQSAPASKPTMPQGTLDSTNMVEMQASHSPNLVALTSATSTSVGIPTAAYQPPMEVDLPKRRDPILNDHLSLAVAPAQRKQEADDANRPRNQPREGRVHAPINPAPPTSSGTGIERSRSSQTGMVDDTSRPPPSRSWYQSAKQPEMRSPRPSVMDLPSTNASAVNNQSIPGPNLQPLSRTASHGGNTRDPGPQFVAAVAQTPSGPSTIDQLGNPFKAVPPTVIPSSSTARYVSHDSHLDDLQSPKPVHAVVPASVTRDVHHRENAHELTATRQRGQDVPQAAVGGHRVEIYPSQISMSVQQPTPHAPSRLPVVEDVVERPGTANRLERVKFSYPSVPAPAPAPDLHHGLLSPVQQAIRAPPTPKLRSLSYDAQNNDFRSRPQPDIPTTTSTASLQQVPSRSQPYGTTPRPTLAALPVQTTQSSLDLAPSIMTQGSGSYSTNPPPPSRPDESTTSLRMAPSVYPSVPAYPTAPNRSDLQVYPQTQNNMQEARRKDSNSSDSSQLASRHAPPVSDMSRPNLIPRTNDASQKPSVNLSQAYPAPQPSEPPAFPISVSAQISTSTHHRNVSLTNSTPQPSPAHVPRPKLSYSSINPPHATPPTPAGSLYRFQSDSQQTIISTRVPVAGYASTPILPQSRLPPSRAPSKESILMTPASIANVTLPKPRDLRSSSMPPVTRQQSKESKESSKKKNGFFSNMFRKTSTQRPHEVWHPPTSDKPAENNRSQSSLPPTGKARELPSSSNMRPTDTTRSGTQKRTLPPIAVNLPPRAPAPAPAPAPEQKVFSAFKLLHTKRNRTMSHASVEAQDGLTHTATNTVVGSPVQSPNTIFIPPLRDPIVAAHEWVASEEAETRNRTKRRRRPGVVFDMEEDPPEPPPGTAPKKLSRRRQ